MSDIKNEFNWKHFKKSDGSHLPVLMKLLSVTDGPILELGAGFFSTPFLHWMCNGKRRKLVTYESSQKYFDVARNFITDFHEVHLIDDWDKLDLSQHWNIIFIDHGPGVRRNVEMARVANCADYVVVHDTEAKSDWHYNFSKAFHLYKNRFDYKKAYPETSVLSNFKDLTFLNEID
jgi:hypothetical protein